MKIVIAGCLGRMGKTLMQYVDNAEDATLVGGTCLDGSETQAREFLTQAGISDDVLITSDMREALAAADAVIDFTTPEYTLEIAKLCAELGKIHVSGTTGLEPDQQAELEELAKQTRIIHAPNMSICVNVFMKLTEQVASILDEEFDIEIVEMHHRFKADAPSGTALGVGKAAAKGRGVELDDVADRGRDGMTGAREKGRIGFAALRGGDVVGDHTVTFAGMGERLELTHKASNRDIYARGATKAVIWAADKPAGYYSMYDVLGL